MKEGFLDYQNFQSDRAQIERDLEDLRDRSRKGSIDEPARRFLELINSQPDWITTSSCSGRLVTYLPGSSSSAQSQTEDEFSTNANGSGPSQANQRSVNGKGAGNWLFVSHSTLTREQLDDPLKTLFGNHEVLVTGPDSPERVDLGNSQVVNLIYQPPVFHLLARSVPIGASILRAVIRAGFRNSGLTISQRGRVILAIRAAAGGLDVPIAVKINGSTDTESLPEEQKFRLLVMPEYLRALLLQGSRLMEQNEERLQRLFVELEGAFLKECATQTDKEWETPQDRRERMKAEGLALQASKLKRALLTQDDDEGNPPVLNLLD